MSAVVSVFLRLSRFERVLVSRVFVLLVVGVLLVLSTLWASVPNTLGFWGLGTVGDGGWPLVPVVGCLGSVASRGLPVVPLRLLVLV